VKLDEGFFPLVVVGSSNRFVQESMLFTHETSVGKICDHWPYKKKKIKPLRDLQQGTGMLLAKMNWCKNKQEQISAIQKGWNTGRGRGCHVYLKLCLWISLLSS